jgi:hypothetical protein
VAAAHARLAVAEAAASGEGVARFGGARRRRRLWRGGWAFVGGAAPVSEELHGSLRWSSSDRVSRAEEN